MGPKPKTDATGGVAVGGEVGAVPRALRADALRNRARVLEAAEVVFAAQGLDVPVDLIAEKAGVGVGTLYRHFPTKEKLCEAILTDRLAALAAEARCRLDAPDPGAAFFGFLEHLVAEASLKRDLINAMTGAGLEIKALVGEVKQDLEAALEELLGVAQRAGAVRADVTSPVVLTLTMGACMSDVSAHVQVSPSDVLPIIFDALRASAR